MFKTAAILGALALFAIQIPGCSSTISASQVQQYAQTACAFLPTADTIANIVSSNPNLKTAEQVAAVICQAIASTPPATGVSPVVGDSQVAVYVSPNGQKVPIIGHWSH